MAQGKSTRLAAIILLVLALCLAWRLFPNAEPASENKQPASGQQPASAQKTPAAEDQPPPSETVAPSAQAEATPPAKIAERKEGITIRDLEKYGIRVEAEHVGKNSATGKVRVSTKEGAVLEADQAKMSPNGMLVAEGNPFIVHGEQRMNVGGENGAMAIYFDEEKQTVIMRAGVADRITKPFSSEGVIDPDRSGVK